MGIVDRCASSETANMHRISVVAALLAALVAGSHAISVALKVTPGSVSGKNVVCELGGDTDNFSQTGVSYSIDGSRLFAVEYTGKSVQYCYIEVLAPTTTTTPEPEVIRWRSDYRCGSRYKDPQGNAAICNPNSGHKCCSPWGWCDGTRAHCACSGCKDYSKILGTTTTTPKPASTTPKPLVMSELGQFTSNMHPCTTGTSSLM